MASRDPLLPTPQFQGRGRSRPFDWSGNAGLIANGARWATSVSPVRGLASPSLASTPLEGNMGKRGPAPLELEKMSPSPWLTTRKPVRATTGSDRTALGPHFEWNLFLGGGGGGNHRQWPSSRSGPPTPKGRNARVGVEKTGHRTSRSDQFIGIVEAPPNVEHPSTTPEPKIYVPGSALPLVFVEFETKRSRSPFIV